MSQTEARLPLPQHPLPRQPAFAETSRRDAWWVQPLLVVLGLGAFIVYSTWAAFQGEHYFFHGDPSQYALQRDYLSPFYSPVLFDPPGVHSNHAWFGEKPDWLWWPGWLVFSPAFLILWAPGLFRFTCYYYRGAYYKAFWADPPSCAVGEPRKSYWGERYMPLLLQNIHRYALYLALIFLVILSYDAWRAMWFLDPATGEWRWGLGVGTLVLIINPILLGGYTLGCHSFRHLIGGRLDQLSRRRVQKKAYDCASCLNRRHMQWAWASLFWVGFADVYVRLCSMGVFTDFKII